MQFPEDLSDLSFGIPSPTPEGTQRMKAIIEKRRGEPVSAEEAEDALRRVIAIVWYFNLICTDSVHERAAGGGEIAQKGELGHASTTAPQPKSTRRAAGTAHQLRTTMEVKRAAGQVTGRLPLGYTLSQVNGICLLLSSATGDKF